MSCETVNQLPKTIPTKDQHAVTYREIPFDSLSGLERVLTLPPVQDGVRANLDRRSYDVLRSSSRSLNDILPHSRALPLSLLGIGCQERLLSLSHLLDRDPIWFDPNIRCPSSDPSNSTVLFRCTQDGRPAHTISEFWFCRTCHDFVREELLSQFSWQPDRSFVKACDGCIGDLLRDCPEDCLELASDTPYWDRYEGVHFSPTSFAPCDCWEGHSELLKEAEGRCATCSLAPFLERTEEYLNVREPLEEDVRGVKLQVLCLCGRDIRHPSRRYLQGWYCHGAIATAVFFRRLASSYLIEAGESPTCVADDSRGRKKHGSNGRKDGKRRERKERAMRKRWTTVMVRGTILFYPVILSLHSFLVILRFWVFFHDVD